MQFVPNGQQPNGPALAFLICQFDYVDALGEPLIIPTPLAYRHFYFLSVGLVRFGVIHP